VKLVTVLTELFTFVNGPLDTVERYTLYPATVEVLGDHVRATECDTTATPEPDKLIDVGELLASLVTVTLPVMVPELAGANVTLSIAVCAGARMRPAETPLGVKPAPVTLTFEIVTLVLPEFVNVTPKLLLLPTVTFPKLRDDLSVLRVLIGLGLTVRMAALLVAFPAELLTVTVNCALLSADVVAGVT